MRRLDGGFKRSSGGGSGSIIGRFPIDDGTVEADCLRRLCCPSRDESPKRSSGGGAGSIISRSPIDDGTVEADCLICWKFRVCHRR